METIVPWSYTLPRMEPRRVTILGSGKVAKSILMVSALKALPIKYDVISRSDKGAELIKLVLNDIPYIDVNVAKHEEIPDLSGELVVLCLGESTSERTKLKTKSALHDINKEIVSKISDKLANSIVIVITNPSTLITKQLLESGINAIGVGVANDQNRLSSSTKGNVNGWHFIGPHEFSELIIGSHFSKVEFEYSFGRDAYKRITSEQDKHRANWIRRAIQRKEIFDYSKLSGVNSAFPPEYRWYARQRIHSKVHDTTISCALAAVSVIQMIFNMQNEDRIVTLETRVFLERNGFDIVAGWPFDSQKREPVPLSFSRASLNQLKDISEKYKITNSDETEFILTTPFGQKIKLSGKPEQVHRFYSSHLKYVYSLSRRSVTDDEVAAHVKIADSRAPFDTFAIGANDNDWATVAQHMGKNPQEHTSLKVLSREGQRAVKFPGDGTCAVLNDIKKTALLYSPREENLFHELRRLLRDELAIPLFASGGARVLHAALASVAGVNILVVARSGGGKTTFVLSLLCENESSRYGSSERTAVWVRDGKLVGIGIPESVTVFPGTLASFPEFRELSASTDPSELWVPSAKLRLQQDEITERTSSSIIQGASPIDVVVEIDFQRDNSNGNHLVKITDKLEAKKIIGDHDITTSDTVRLEWLKWVQRSSNVKILNQIDAFYGNTKFYRLPWSDIADIRRSLREILGELVMSRGRTDV